MNPKKAQKKLLEYVKKNYLSLKIGPHHLSIPYWCNKYKNKVLVSEGPFGGKGSPQQIADLVHQIAAKEKISLKKIKREELLLLMKRYHLGLDCSGLAYQLLDYYYRLLGKEGIYYQLLGHTGRRGIYSINANALTSSPNSISIPLTQTQTGDLLRTNNGRHVIFVLSRQKDQINYVHSSYKTQTKGVHLGTINLKDPQKPIFTEKTKDNQPYERLFSLKTMAFRPHFLK